MTVDLTNELRKSLKILFPVIPNDKMNCVEIGSFEGIGSIVIHDNLCKDVESKLFCIDPFDDEYVKGNEKMAFWNHACKGQMARFYNNTKNYKKIIPMQGYSDEMIIKIEDNSLDFAYIDGDHSPEQVYKDAVNILPKMKIGSIILFDDYLWNMNNIQTKIGIDKFLEDYSFKVKLLLKNYQLAVEVIN